MATGNKQSRPFDVLTAAIWLQLEVCKEQVQWAQSEKRTFLRQRIEIRLATLYLETKEYTSAISLIGKLLTEVIVRDPVDVKHFALLCCISHHQACGNELCAVPIVLTMCMHGIHRQVHVVSVWAGCCRLSH